MTTAQAGVIGFLVMYLLPFIIFMIRPNSLQGVSPFNKINLTWAAVGAVVGMIAQAVWNF